MSAKPLRLTGVRSVEAVPGGAWLTITVEGRTGGFIWLLSDPRFA